MAHACLFHPPQSQVVEKSQVCRRLLSPSQMLDQVTNGPSVVRQFYGCSSFAGAQKTTFLEALSCICWHVLLPRRLSPTSHVVSLFLAQGIPAVVDDVPLPLRAWLRPERAREPTISPPPIPPPLSSFPSPRTICPPWTSCLPATSSTTLGSHCWGETESGRSQCTPCC